MMSLFSPFDLLFFYASSYFSMAVVFLALQPVFIKNSSNSILQIFFLNFGKSFYVLKPTSYTKISLMLFCTIIFLLITLNFLSVFPFIFPITSQFGTILSFSLTIWLSLFLFSFFSNIKGMISHMIPEGAPLALSVFLFLIEIVSMSIRPLTLTVRLVANILAGHLLMILLSKLVFIAGIPFLTYMILNVVELVVSFIQAYIFTILVGLYFSDMF